MEKTIFSKDYETFLRHLRETRERAKLSQVQLAAKLGQTQSWISKCERGERRLDIVEVRAFCRAMGLDFTTFAAEFDRLADTS